MNQMEKIHGLTIFILIKINSLVVATVEFLLNGFAFSVKNHLDLATDRPNDDVENHPSWMSFCAQSQNPDRIPMKKNDYQEISSTGATTKAQI